MGARAGASRAARGPWRWGRLVTAVLDVGSGPCPPASQVPPTVCGSAATCSGCVQSLDLLPQPQGPSAVVSAIEVPSLLALCPTLPLCLGPSFIISLSFPSSVPLAWQRLAHAATPCRALGRHHLSIPAPSHRAPQHAPQYRDSLLDLAHGRQPVCFARPPICPAIAMTPSLAPAPPANTHHPPPPPPLPSGLLESADASGSQVKVDPLRRLWGLGTECDAGEWA